jgi:hypothetical protein
MPGRVDAALERSEVRNLACKWAYFRAWTRHQPSTLRCYAFARVGTSASGPVRVALARSGDLQAIDVQRVTGGAGGDEESTLDNTARSRVDARAPDNRELPVRNGLPFAADMHGASGKPGDAVLPDRRPRHFDDHGAEGSYIPPFRLAELWHDISKNRRLFDGVAVVNLPRSLAVCGGTSLVIDCVTGVT